MPRSRDLDLPPQRLADGTWNREYTRAYYRANQDRIQRREAQRWAEKRDEIMDRRRAFKAANRDDLLERQRSYSAKWASKWAGRKDHRMLPEEWAAFWTAQDGKCYLCRDPLASEDVRAIVIEHDHRCCQNNSCRVCRRGLACLKCNSAIGMALDDPARLRRMADALEIAQAKVRQRMAERDAQLALFGEEEAAS